MGGSSALTLLLVFTVIAVSSAQTQYFDILQGLQQLFQPYQGNDFINQFNGPTRAPTHKQTNRQETRKKTDHRHQTSERRTKKPPPTNHYDYVFATTEKPTRKTTKPASSQNNSRSINNKKEYSNVLLSEYYNPYESTTKANRVKATTTTTTTTKSNNFNHYNSNNNANRGTTQNVFGNNYNVARPVTENVFGSVNHRETFAVNNQAKPTNGASLVNNNYPGNTNNKPQGVPDRNRGNTNDRGTFNTDFNTQYPNVQRPNNHRQNGVFIAENYPGFDNIGGTGSNDRETVNYNTNNRGTTNSNTNNRGNSNVNTNNRAISNTNTNNRGNSYSNNNNNRGTTHSNTNNRGYSNSNTNNRENPNLNTNNRGVTNSNTNNRGITNSNTNNRGVTSSYNNNRGTLNSNTNRGTPTFNNNRGTANNYNTNNNWGNPNNYNQGNTNPSSFYYPENPLINRPGVQPAPVDVDLPPITNRPVPSNHNFVGYNRPSEPSSVTFTDQPDREPDILIGPDEDDMTDWQKRRFEDTAERMCDYYKSLTIKKVVALPLIPSPDPVEVNVSDCTPINVPLVIGGTVANIQEFPHMALVGWTKVRNAGYSWKCGGSLISDRYILTAGHCTYQDKDANVVSGPPHAVQLGSSFLDDPGALVVKISAVIRHPKYKQRRSYHDIALIKMVTKVRFSEVIRPACLGYPPPEGRSIIATGWGRTEFGGDHSSQLRSVSLTVWNMEECREIWGTSLKLPNGVTPDSHMCAGERGGGKDTCQGDSGGPAQIQDGCLWRVVAVTSYGRSCGAPETPALYAVIPHAFVAAQVFSERS